MSDFNEPAHPVKGQLLSRSGVYEIDAVGLTIRQTAALMAMQGIVTDCSWNGDIEAAAKSAVMIADAVLRAEKESRE